MYDRVFTGNCESPVRTMATTLASRCVAATPRSAGRAAPVPRRGLLLRREEERATRSKESRIATCAKRSWSEIGCRRQVPDSDFDEALGSIPKSRLGRREAMRMMLSLSFAQFLLLRGGPHASALAEEEDGSGETSVGVVESAGVENFQTTTEVPTGR